MSSSSVDTTITDRYPVRVTPRILATKNKKLPHSPPNGRKSTRYNLFTFLPITILYQFTRVVNCFYVLNAFLQSTPSISTNDPLATIIPLTFIICVGIIKEAIVEVKRWLQDRQVNRIPTRRLTAGGTLEEITLAQVKQGDVLKILDGEQIPADCILLRCKK